MACRQCSSGRQAQPALVRGPAAKPARTGPASSLKTRPSFTKSVCCPASRLSILGTYIAARVSKLACLQLQHICCKQVSTALVFVKLMVLTVSADSLCLQAWHLSAACSCCLANSCLPCAAKLVCVLLAASLMSCATDDTPEGWGNTSLQCLPQKRYKWQCGCNKARFNS